MGLEVIRMENNANAANLQLDSNGEWWVIDICECAWFLSLISVDIMRSNEALTHKTTNFCHQKYVQSRISCTIREHTCAQTDTSIWHLFDFPRSSANR